MAHLASIESVRVMHALEDFSEVTEQISLALTMATSAVEGFLGAPLSHQVGVDDYFELDNRPFHADYYDLALSRLFLDTSALTITHETAGGDSTILTTDQYRVLDADRSYIRLKDVVINPGDKVFPTFTAGLESAQQNNDPSLPQLFQNVPQWLEAAARHYASEYYQFLREYRDKDGKVEGVELSNAVAQILASHRRTRQTVIYPE